MAHPTPVARFFGYAMVTVGILMAVLSGGCTLVGFFISLNDRAYGMIGVVLMVGLPFFGIGLGLFFGGRSIIRSGRPKTPPGDVF